jgi:hypothetical protein
MSDPNAALAFLERLCAGNIDSLVPFLDERLEVTGPLHRFTLRTTYLESLKADSPQSCTYQVLSVTAGEDTVAVFYEYRNGDGVLTIAQLVRFRNHLIVKMRLVFATDGFEQP